jgi:thioredoxin 1
MSMNTEYAKTAPERSEVDALTGPTVVEFGTDWCGHCRAAQPLIAQAFQDHGSVTHMKIEDGSGRPLGRSFRVKLWPTLVFMLGGKEVARLVRPRDAGEIRDALALIDEPISQ